MSTLSQIPHRPLGLGLGWREGLALAIDRNPRLGFVEILAEDFFGLPTIPEPIDRLRERGVVVVPHGVGLSLGGSEPPDPTRLEALGRLATRLEAPLVSEHVAFVRAGGIESGHLLPLPRTREALRLLVANIRAAQAALPVPLALENIASLVAWPGNEMDEAEFLSEVLEQTGASLLLDLANVYANARNHDGDPISFLGRIPLDRLAYVHVAGGIERDGFYHDTHTAPVSQAVLMLVEELAALVDVPGVLIERDDAFPAIGELDVELEALASALERGEARRRTACHVL
jgi:uncharacterized protein (UPF0276 family)